jgi:hypothetical protein
MLHIVHLIQNRRAGRATPAALPLAALSALVLLAGTVLLLGR